MPNEVSAQDFVLRSLEEQYIDDLRQKNRLIAELRMRVQLLTQQLQNHSHGEDGEVVPQDAVQEVEAPEVDNEST